MNTEKVPTPEIARKFHADPVKRFVVVFIVFHFAVNFIALPSQLQVCEPRRWPLNIFAFAAIAVMPLIYAETFNCSNYIRTTQLMKRDTLPLLLFYFPPKRTKHSEHLLFSISPQRPSSRGGRAPEHKL